jgi:tRNA threonylcarbamoyladenosine biosynthesis protein TsaE
MSASARGAADVPVHRVELESSGADQTHAHGGRLARLLRAGDVVVLSGALGSGKTTLAQGIGASLGIRGDVTSPTFVISRVHPSLVGGPALVHVDAYRISGAEELDDLDLDETLEEAVTLVEWGEGLADLLAENRLRVRLSRQRGADDPGTPTEEHLLGDEPRAITVEAFGPRWAGVPLKQMLVGTPDSCSSPSPATGQHR